MKIYIGSDHAGFARKQVVASILSDMGIAFEDVGVLEDESVDYPEYGMRVAQAVMADAGSLGIAVCGSGVGISIAANKVPGARCMLCDTPERVVQAREHAGIQILGLAGRGEHLPELQPLIEAFLNTNVDGAARHARRRNQLNGPL